MLNIIVCEDNLIQRTQIEKIINTELLNFKVQSSIVLSTDNPDTVIHYLETGSGDSYIYFLDVDLKREVNGIELSKKIREFDPRGYIVFVSSHAELSLLTFQYKVQALDYIFKADFNNLNNKISECLTEAFNDYDRLNKNSNTYISIDLGSRIANFPYEEILFFETIPNKDHKLRIHTDNGHFEFYGSLRDLEAKLISKGYLKVHRSYLVNIRKIKLIDKNNHMIHMINGETCFLSARYSKGLIKKCLI